MRLELSLAGDTQLNRELLRFSDRVVHARPLFELMGDELLRIEREQFYTEGKYASGGWAPLAEATISAKGDSSILFDTGDLMQSLTERGGDNILIAEDTWFLFGTSDPKAAFHQRGTGELEGHDQAAEGAKGMPRRRPLELTEHDRRMAVKAAQRFFLTNELQGWQ
jgi:phage gpG-like protein